MLWLILLAIIVATIFIVALFSSPTTKGKIGESIVAHKLNAFSANKEGNYLLQNLYVPKANGDTTEIDEVYITSKGLIVIECKNYKGYIFGIELRTGCIAGIGDREKGFNADYVFATVQSLISNDN